MSNPYNHTYNPIQADPELWAASSNSHSESHASSEIVYYASKTTKEFHLSDAFIRALIGPIGSGKSVACVMEMMMRSHNQKPNAQGVRKSRWVVIRNTYRELVDTTIQTFQDWFPESLGIFLRKDMKFTINRPLPDGTYIHVEFLFRALDKPQDIRKLLSLEVTGGWINEVREIPKSILDMLIGRLGRYPNKRDGGPSWFGLIMDTNPPDSDHWFYKLFEIDLPDNYAIFHQPSGISPEAENIDNLPEGYYQKMQAGKDQEWINVYVHGLYGFVQDGKPVFPEYHDDIHATNQHIIPDDSFTIHVGIDFGLTPAATFGYQNTSGRWIIFDELVAEDMGADNFSKMLKLQCVSKYPNHTIEFHGDPAGDQRAQTDEITPFQILQRNGILAVPTYTNDFIIRREAVAMALQRLDFVGNPAFVVTKGAPMTRKALAGGYKYKRMAVSGGDRYADKPDKNRYSHIGDALQYLLLGAGEGDTVIGGYKSDKIDYSLTDRMIR